jgi:replication factor C subunit 3/5
MENVDVDEHHAEYAGLLWVDRCRPTTFEACVVHKELNERLRRLSESPAHLPHLLFYGPAGSGKRTRVRLLLRELYGIAVDHSHVEHRLVRVGDPPRSLEYTTVSSAYHIELNPSDVGYSDRLLVQAVIKEIAGSRPLLSSAEQEAMVEGGTSTETASKRLSYKVVVLHDVDRLTREAQQALRRTMEKYAQTCRLVLIADSATRVLEPLRSRCLGIRVRAPSETELRTVLRQVWQRMVHSAESPPEALLDHAIRASDGNLRSALLSLEASYWTSKAGRKGSALPEPDWRSICDEIADQIRKEQTPPSLLRVRALYYDLLTHCIPVDIILSMVLRRLLERVPVALGQQLCFWAAEYEYRACMGSKAILHLEAFAAKCMALIRMAQTAG